MQRPTLWLMLVVLLLGILFLREPRLERSEEFFLRWLLKNSDPHAPAASLTVVDIGHDNLMEREPTKEGDESSPHSGTNVVSPMEFALFLQSALEFQPTVIAFENVLKWREIEKDQEQVFSDQAMRVPRLLLAAELTTAPDPDAPGPEIPGFAQVTGKRGDLVEFSGISRQPSEELRLIATAGGSLVTGRGPGAYATVRDCTRPLTLAGCWSSSSWRISSSVRPAPFVIVKLLLDFDCATIT